MDETIAKEHERFLIPPYFTYLCGPMFGKTKDEMSGWRDYVKSKLDNCIDPVTTELPNHTPDEIVKQDLNDIARSNFLLVKYDPSAPMVGSSMEMFFAAQVLQPSRFILTMAPDVEKVSPWLSQHSHLLIAYQGTETLDYVIEKIKKCQNILEGIHNKSFDLIKEQSKMYDNINSILLETEV